MDVSSEVAPRCEYCWWVVCSHCEACQDPRACLGAGGREPRCEFQVARFGEDAYALIVHGLGMNPWAIADAAAKLPRRMAIYSHPVTGEFFGCPDSVVFPVPSPRSGARAQLARPRNRS